MSEKILNHEMPMQTVMPVLAPRVEQPDNKHIQAYALELVRSEKDFKSSYKDRVRKQVMDGFLPQNALQHFRSIDRLKLTYQHGIHSQMEGIYQAASDWTAPKVELKGNLQDDMFEHYFVHELNHALSSDTKNGYDIAYEFINMFGVHGRVVMEEALTEHLAASMLHGEFETINPYDRQDGLTRESDYTLYREFLDLLANGGEEPIDIRDFYSALYFGETNEQGGISKAATDWQQAVRRAFPDIEVLAELKKLKLDDNAGLRNLMNRMVMIRQSKEKSGRLQRIKSKVNTALTKAAMY